MTVEEQGEEQRTTDKGRLRGLEAMIDGLYRRYPLEDGYEHPAELALTSMLDIPHASTYIVRMFVRAAFELEADGMSSLTPEFGAFMLRILGRIRPEKNFLWMISLAGLALSSDDIEIREAGVRACESWAIDYPEECLGLLCAYLDDDRDERRWLLEYAEKVAQGIRYSQNDE